MLTLAKYFHQYILLGK